MVLSSKSQFFLLKTFTKAYLISENLVRLILTPFCGLLIYKNTVLKLTFCLCLVKHSTNTTIGGSVQDKTDDSKTGLAYIAKRADIVQYFM